MYILIVSRLLDFFWPTHYVGMIYVLIVSNNCHFLNPNTQSFAYVIYEWSLVKFMFSKKATKIDKIFTVDLTLT